MKVLILLAAVLPFAGILSAADLRENEFFATLEGNWKGEGEMTNAEGETQPLANEIECRFIDDGATFTIEGSLQPAEGDEGEQNEPLDYRWVFTEHSIDGLYLGEFRNLNEDDGDGTFEVSINEEELRAELTESSGSAGGSNRVELTKRIEDGNYLVDFVFLDSGGRKNLEGHLEFERAD